jgi:hypothetical protein
VIIAKKIKQHYEQLLPMIVLQQHNCSAIQHTKNDSPDLETEQNKFISKQTFACILSLTNDDDDDTGVIALRLSRFSR